MKPEIKSKKALSITQAKAKMIEYDIPTKHHELKVEINPQELFSLTIGLLGDYSHKLNQSNTSKQELLELKNNLRFSARFFDTYLKSEFNNELDEYFILVGSATYYLCDMPGNSTVLLKKLDGKLFDLTTNELDKLLFWILKFDTPIKFNGIYKDTLQKIVNYFHQYFKDGTNKEKLAIVTADFRKLIYANGSDRSLLFLDIISAVIRRKIENSCWEVLPYYSGINIDIWKNVIQKHDFIKEFWPAQHLIGEKDVFQGKSVVIQMPTSAGKTKTNEIIIRSAFLSERTSSAVIIAPFRALCHEIYNDLYKVFKNENIFIYELTDVLQLDLATEQLQDKKQIFIVTPEKLFYVLSHNKDIAMFSGLFIFDEGHQFDTGKRGITYELLLTTLLLLIPENTQKVLISAVLTNTEQISDWLNGGKNVVSGKNLLPTFKSIGFTSWNFQLGQIHYVAEDNLEEEAFYVPRVIEQIEMKKINRERNQRFFPLKEDSSSISLYLGLKLIQNGSIAIFCGRKSSVSKICEKLIDLTKRDFRFDSLRLPSTSKESKRLAELYAMNLGCESLPAKGSELGVFSHHHNIPHGIRIAVEYAMHESLINFVVCTSTLAQGVNLPIRYLIISGLNQGGEYIRARDFHNLIGRAGRAGMHTEGSILFSDPKIYDSNDRWLWKKAQGLLDPEKSESCSSELLAIFYPLNSNDEKKTVEFEAIYFFKNYFISSGFLDKTIDKILNDNQSSGFTRDSLEQQFLYKLDLISSIENFMLSNWDDLERLKGENAFSNIVIKTFGYSLANGELKNKLSELFNIIEENIRNKIQEPEKRKMYGRTLYGLNDAFEIESWFNSNIQALLSANDEEQLLNVIWDLFQYIFVNKKILKLTNIESLKMVMKAWINGSSYYDMMNIFYENDIMIKWGKTTRKIDVDKVVEICDANFSFTGCMILNTIHEFAIQDIDENQRMLFLLEKLQRLLKYGLSDEPSIIIYEIGFCDRVIAQDIKNSLNIADTDRLTVIHTIRSKRDLATVLISKYPAYYQMKMTNLVNQGI